MRGALGLFLYRLGAGRPGGQTSPPWPERPAGRLVWLHCPGPQSLAQGVELARQLAEDAGLAVLITSTATAATAPGADGHDPPAGATLWAPPPPDRPEAVAAFLQHFHPEAVVLFEGELRPVLLDGLAQRRLPVLLADAGAPHLPPGRRGWYPGLVARGLGQVAAVLAHDDPAAKALGRAGAAADRLWVSGPLEEASAALPCNESERAFLAQALAARPIWLAIGLPPDEEALVVEAHREALKASHRLLLILAPEDAARAPALAAELEAREGWQVACRSLEQEPEAETEVYVVDGAAEAGLWYRLAPVSYLGGGQGAQGCRRNPMEGAALGSALILGPRPGPWARAYEKFAKGPAARLAGTAGELQVALSELLAPDRAARQAQTAWDIASEGSEVTERVVSLLQGMIAGAPLPARLGPADPLPIPAAGAAAAAEAGAAAEPTPMLVAAGLTETNR